MREERTPRSRASECRFEQAPARRYRTETYDRDGAVRIWPMQLAVLQGLLDRPKATSRSRKDCVDAAIPHATKLRGSEPSWWRIYDTIAIVARRGWVRRKRVGHCIQISLTRRGRAIVSGEVVARFFGGELYVPGRRRATNGANQGTVVALGRGIDLVLPPGWGTNFRHVNEAAAQGRPTVNAALPTLGSQGIMMMAAPRDRENARPVLTLMLLPTGLSQEACAALSDEAIARLDADQIRPEVEDVARSHQFAISAWHGTVRAVVGGRAGLITSYGLTWPDGLGNRKETHVAYLGKRQLVAHVYLPMAHGTPSEVGARRILTSLRILPSRL